MEESGKQNTHEDQTFKQEICTDKSCNSEECKDAITTQPPTKNTENQDGYKKKGIHLHLKWYHFVGIALILALIICGTLIISNLNTAAKIDLDSKYKIDELKMAFTSIDDWLIMSDIDDDFVKEDFAARGILFSQWNEEIGGDFREIRVISHELTNLSYDHIENFKNYSEDEIIESLDIFTEYKGEYVWYDLFEDTGSIAADLTVKKVAGVKFITFYENLIYLEEEERINASRHYSFVAVTKHDDNFIFIIFDTLREKPTVGDKELFDTFVDSIVFY